MPGSKTPARGRLGEAHGRLEKEYAMEVAARQDCQISSITRDRDREPVWGWRRWKWCLLCEDPRTTLLHYPTLTHARWESVYIHWVLIEVVGSGRDTDLPGRQDLYP